jgi:hypothetical protein
MKRSRETARTRLKLVEIRGRVNDANRQLTDNVAAVEKQLANAKQWILEML